MTAASTTERQRILVETTDARDKAQTLLRGLLDARTTCERHISEGNGSSDLLKRVTGQSSIDNAIASTQQMVEALNRAINQFTRELTDEDLTMLEEGP